MREYLLTNASDNVITCIKETGLEKGTYLKEFDVVTKDFIPFGHKVLLEDLPANGPIIRYGVVIGYLKENKVSGSLVNETNTYIKKTRDLENFDGSYSLREAGYDIPDISDRYFLGYVNDDGSVGTKNILAINTTVQCTAGVVKKAVEILRKEYLPNYKNVDDIVFINHLYGCGVAIHGKDADIPKRIITNISKNPNLCGAPLVVSLGCEKFIVEDAFPHINKENVIVMQEEVGHNQILNIIIEKALKNLEILNLRKRERVPISKLNLGVQCGGSDAFSGITSNPVIGFAVDAFAKANAKVCFSEVTEVRDGAEILLSRMKDYETRRKFIKDIQWYDEYLARSNVDRSENPAPGNKKGGLTNIVDKAMGSIAKSGFSEIKDVVTYGGRLEKPGLTFLSTPASDFVCGTSQLAGGVTLQVFSTGRGTPYNLREYPVIKVSSNYKLGRFWEDLIDINAGDILEGKETIESKGLKLIEYIIQVASGEKKVKSDINEIYNDLSVFNPAAIT